MLLLVSAVLLYAGYEAGALALRLWTAAERHMPETKWEQVLPLRGRWLRYLGTLLFGMIAIMSCLLAAACGLFGLVSLITT